MADKSEGLRIFLVDDDPFFVDKIQDDLEDHREGVHKVVLVATNTEDALACIPNKVKKKQSNPDCYRWA